MEINTHIFNTSNNKKQKIHPPVIYSYTNSVTSAKKEHDVIVYMNKTTKIAIKRIAMHNLICQERQLFN